MKYYAYIVITIFLFSSCSPKTSKELVEEEQPSTVEEVTCPQFKHLSGYEREQAEDAFVLYKDYFGMGKYDIALPYWRKAFTLAPGSNGVVKSHFDDGVTLYADLLSKSEDESLSKSYIDTINMIYAKREDCFPVDADYYAQKGFDYYYKLKDYVDEGEIYEMFKKSIAEGNGNIKYYIINPFTKLLYDRVNDSLVGVNEASKYATDLTQTIKNGLATCKGQSCESWNIINEYAPDLLSSFEGIDGFYDCDYYTEKYFSLFESNPEDCDIINTALARMLRGGCDDTGEDIALLKKAKEEKCYTPPPPPGLLRQGYDAYSSGDYKKAIEFFEQYVEENDDVEKKAKYTMLIAKIYYGDIKNYAQSRAYARKAAKIKEGWGEPYILIGKLYASSGPLCGPGRGFESQKVTWPAIDMFQYAKQIDPNVAGEANKWINTYKVFMPSKEDIFQRGIKEGSSYYVGCWIQENTIVRTAN